PRPRPTLFPYTTLFRSIADDAVAFLKSQQKANGGWSADNADQYGEDSNTTALVIQALLSAGVPSDDATITGGFTYLQSVFSHGRSEEHTSELQSLAYLV